MSVNIRLPNITGGTQQEQLLQIKSYLIQMAGELNWALEGIQGGGSSRMAEHMPYGSAGQGAAAGNTGQKAQEALQNFNSIKGLIIKSADIVNAYYEKIDTLLKTSGEYVAQSEFGDYSEKVTQRLDAAHDSLTQYISRVETVENTANGAYDSVKKQEGYIRYGTVGTTLDPSGIAKEDALGIEIGDYHEMEAQGGSSVDQRFARFTAYGLELFGSDQQIPVAYLSGRKLYITNAEITGSLQVGGYILETKSGLAFKWVRR